MGRLHASLVATALIPLACAAPSSSTSAELESSTTDPGTGDGDGDPTSGDGDGDGDGDASGDGDGDASGDGDGDPALACNGHVELCERRFDEVVFAGTHNAHAANEHGFAAPLANQVYGVPRQLDDGVRMMWIDSYEQDGEVVLCHGPCDLASVPHLDILAAIVEFMAENPGELITLIYEDYVSAEQLAADYEASGAVELVYAHTPGEPWPTLGELVAANTRLVVAVQSGGPPPAWHHNVWTLAWDTPYGPQDPAELSCALNRGDADNDLMLINHWVNSQLGLPSAENAELVNAYSVLLGRAEDCAAQWDHPPNFLIVDFYDRGDLFAVVETLNGF